MSDLKLVAPDQPTPLEQLLLEAAASESPSDAQRTRVRQALGLSALPMVAPSSDAASARRSNLGKIALGAAIIGPAAAVAVWLGLLHRPVSPTRSAPAAAASVTAPSAAPQPLSSPMPEPLPPPLPARQVSSDARASSAVRSKPPSKLALGSHGRDAPQEGADLSEQLRLIDAARAAVASGDARAASLALTTYGSKFPRGAFGQEAAVLHIETVELQGNHAQASALAQAFLAAHPNSPHVGLVRRIAGN